MNSSVSAPVSSRKYSAIVRRRQRHAKTRARRLVHLAEDHDGLIDDVLAGLADLGFLHFQPEVGPFAGAFADAGEDRIAAVLLGDAGDQFLDDDGLAQTRPAEQSGLAAAKERREQVDHLDAGFEHLGLGGEIDKFRRLAMDRPPRFSVCTGPRLSIGSPSRLKTRPSVSLPTGTVSDDAGIDRHPYRGEGRRSNPARPPGPSPPPRCCCTSPTRMWLSDPCRL